MADSRPNPDAEAAAAAADEDDAADDAPAPAPASSSRQQRNKAEKQRRDKLNTLITELAAMVPAVVESPKRLDKTSILRLSANFLRIARCALLNQSEQVDSDTRRFFSHLIEVLQSLNGFLLVVDGTGKILVVSSNVEKLLGHSQNDMLGHSLFSFTAPEQHEELRRHLTPDGQPAAPAPSAAAASAVSPGVTSGDDSMSSADSASSTVSSPPPAAAPAPAAAAAAAAACLPVAPAASPAGSASACSPASACTSTASDAASASAAASAACSAGGGTAPQRQRRAFLLSLSQRAVARGDAVNYETVSVLGYLHVPGRPPPPAGPRHGRKPREPPAPSASDIVLVAVVQQHREKKISEYSLMEFSREEYVTRHFQDGRIAYSDHRIAMVAGYMADEVSGLSAFHFMHKEDVNFTVVALQQMYDLGQGVGGSVYRLRAKTGSYIYLRTQGFLEFKKNSSEVATLICINTLLTDEEGKRMIQEMKQRYAGSIEKCYEITRTGGPLATAVTPEYIPPAVMPAPEQPVMLSPVQIDDHRFVQPSPTSESALSPNQGASPGSSQFANMNLYSPPSQSQSHAQSKLPPPSQPQPSPPVIHYPGVITCPSAASSSTDRPTVLRTQSVIAERVSVLTTTGNPSENLKRTFSVDSDGSKSKKMAMGVPRKQQHKQVSHSPLVTEELKVEISPSAPVLSPEQQHQALVARGVPSFVHTTYKGSWAEVPNQFVPAHTQFTDLSSTCLPRTIPARVSPTPSYEHLPASPSCLDDVRDDDLLKLEDVECFKSDFMQLDTIQAMDTPHVGSECPEWVDFSEAMLVEQGHELSLSAPNVQAYTSVRKQHQLESRLAFPQTQMSRLEQNLDDPLREQFSEIQAQHKKPKQMLHTLKQDHHSLQRQDKLGPGPCVK